MGGSSGLAGGEVGEEGVLAGPAVTVTGIVLRLAAEQIVSLLLLRRELRFLCEHRIVLRGKRRHLGGGLIACDGLRHLIEGAGSPAAINWAKMNRQRLAGRRPPPPGARPRHLAPP